MADGELRSYTGSEHPIARAIADAAKERFGALPAVDAFENVPGRGVRASVEGREVAVGRLRWLVELGWSLDGSLVAQAGEAESHGRTVVAVGWDGDNSLSSRSVKFASRFCPSSGGSAGSAGHWNAAGDREPQLASSDVRLKARNLVVSFILLLL